MYFMQQCIYQYLENFSIHNITRQQLQLSKIQELTLCELNVLCEMIVKSIVNNNPFEEWKQLIQKIYSINKINKTEGWGFVLSLLTGSSIDCEPLLWLKMNLQDPAKFKYILERIVQLFDQQFQQLLISFIVPFVSNICLNTSPLPIHLYVFQQNSKQLNIKFAEDIYYQKQRYILNAIKQFYQKNPPEVCNMFLDFIINQITYDFLNCFRQWLKIQLTKQKIHPNFIQILQFFSKCVAAYDTKSNKNNSLQHNQIFQIPKLYQYFTEYVVKKQKIQYPYYQKFMFKYTLVSQLIPYNYPSSYFQTTEPSNVFLLHTKIEQILVQQQKDIIKIFFSHPHYLWKIILKHYLKESQMKFKKDNLDPLAFVLIKKSFWQSQFHRNILSLCLEVALLQWKLSLPESNQTTQYLLELNKVIIYFLLLIPKTQMIQYYPSHLSISTLLQYGSSKVFPSLVTSCQYIFQLKWLQKFIEHLPHLSTISQDSPLLALRFSQQFKQKIIPEIANRTLISIQMNIRKPKSVFTKKGANLQPLKKLISYYRKFSSLQNQCKFLWQLLGMEERIK